MSQALCDFFGCQRLPFDKSLPVRELFPSTAHQEVQARLSFALQHRFPALITGDVGIGKSTAVRAFVLSLDPNVYLTAYLPNPNLTVQAFFAQLLSTCRVAPTFHPRGLGERLQTTLADLAQRGCQLLIVVDEAHLLSARLLHEIRFWLNAELDAATPFTLVPPLAWASPTSATASNSRSSPPSTSASRSATTSSPSTWPSRPPTSSTTAASRGPNAARSPKALSSPPTSSATASPANSTASASMACSSVSPTARPSSTKPTPNGRRLAWNWIGQPEPCLPRSGGRRAPSFYAPARLIQSGPGRLNDRGSQQTARYCLLRIWFS
ncbi:MAG: AAA family ATPase [Chloroflexi bacterium]|nr:AAA family ATPase [Chloroflexota bacterium]